MAEKIRYALFQKIIEEIDLTYKLICEYDAQLHDYNGVILYQAEAQLIKLIGDCPGISAMECAAKFNKTISACSQLAKKLKSKGWLMQERNELNNRIYNLYLTAEGKQIYRNHRKFEDRCYKRTYKFLESFSEEDLKKFISMNKMMNKAFRLDVEEGKVLVLNEN